ncbi:MAG: molybdopterin molybdenumtransferase MoeA [Epsilonproteobacteria bacterium]|nr:molybdopterin molybdenumtransferase MoeA [Campylobacterota bacterium]NPA63861.1 molybdopterin molybdotransferase MoeA [Campylobacterota bacterium]
MAISIKEALELIEIQKLSLKKESVPLQEALGRVSARSYQATLDLPGFDNSAMDGFAVRCSDEGKEVKVVATIFAGQNVEDLQVQEEEAIKIMTGAKLPKGTEAIVPIEDVEYLGERVVLPKKIKPKSHMRTRGEDVAKGSVIVHEGQTITPYTIGLLASQGYSYIEVFRRPRVAIFATGSELVMHYEPIRGSMIYNSNTPSFLARCEELGCDVSFLGKVEDSLASIKETIQSALDADLIITSGGVSVGEADFTKEAFKAMGMEILFSKIDIKPGKPTTLGKIGDTFVLNLPGNPLAAVLNFELFGRFLINRLKGRFDPYHRPILTRAKEKITLKPGRDTIIPGFFDGESFEACQKRAPGMVSPAARMNGFVIASKEVSSLSKQLRFIPLWEFYSQEFMEIVSK